MKTKLSTKGQVALPRLIRHKLNLEPGDLLDAEVQGGRVTLTPKRKRPRRAEIITDPITSLPVLSAGAGAPILKSSQVREILAEFP